MVTANKGENSLESRVISGYPQGGVASSFLWNLVVNELLGDIERKGFSGNGLRG